MIFEDFKHVTPIQIRFVDIDRLDHVNNACYLNFFELGRVKYFNLVLGNTINWKESGFVIARKIWRRFFVIFVHYKYPFLPK